jgi:hypothetical protein
MAKNTKLTALDLEQRDTNKTPAGFLPKDMLARHKLQFNSPSDMDCVRRRGRVLKDAVEQVSLYRLQVHGVLEKHVARPLVNGLQYMLVPLVDERKVSSTVNSGAGEGANPQLVPLKV